ncbi:MAG: transposase [Anaerolineae bacterium]|nr:transposase [Anaerolineae bacterium]
MSQFDPHKHHRQSIRLKDWDYRSAGYYFVTICTHQRENLFETAVFQEIAAHAIERIPNQKHTAHVELDEWIVMPNHIHLILIFLEIVLSERVGTSDNVF